MIFSQNDAITKWVATNTTVHVVTLKNGQTLGAEVYTSKKAYLGDLLSTIPLNDGNWTGRY